MATKTMSIDITDFMVVHQLIESFVLYYKLVAFTEIC